MISLVLTVEGVALLADSPVTKAWPFSNSKVLWSRNSDEAHPIRIRERVVYFLKRFIQKTYPSQAVGYQWLMLPGQCVSHQPLGHKLPYKSSDFRSE